MPRSAVPVVLRDGDLERLSSLTRASTAPAGLVQRARIVLLAADGATNTEIAQRLSLSRQTVVTWRRRYVDGGLPGLADADRPGRPVVHDEVAVVVATLEPPPESLGVTHWSSRLLGDQLGISFATVARIWRKWELQPWRVETFKFSTDPELEAKIRDVVGLYLAPPANAVVVCIDEKTQVQALDRTAPILPLRPGIPEKATHDYVRHGTTTLFAALEVATGKVTDACYPRHTNTEFLAFLKTSRRPTRAAAARGLRQLRHPQAPQRAGLAREEPPDHPALHPDQRVVAEPGRDLLRHHHPPSHPPRHLHRSVADLIDAIERFIDGWNDRCEPFTWTKTADQILAKAVRPTTSNSRH